MSRRLLLTCLFVVLFAACDPQGVGGGFTAGDEQRDVGGHPYAEHRIAGLRVLETIVGGDAELRDELPVVVHIHGRGDRVRLPGGQFGGLTRPVRLLLPEAPMPFEQGYSWSPVSVTEQRIHELARALDDNAERLAEVLTWVVEHRRVVGKPIVTGFSQGGMLTFTLAAHHPELVGTAIPVAGFLPPELFPRRVRRRALPTIHAIHGIDDPIVRIGPTRRNVRRFRALGYAVDIHELPGVRHLVTDELVAALHERIVTAVARTDAAARR